MWNTERPELLEWRGSVHVGGLIHITVDTLHPRKDEQERKWEIAPDFKDGDHDQGQGAIAEEVDRLRGQTHLD